MDKWYYYKEAVRQFIEATAERWMETQLKKKRSGTILSCKN